MKYLPGILFLLAMPCSVLLFVKVDALTGSEILGLFSAVLLYIAIGGILALALNKKKDPREQDNSNK